MEVTRNEIAKQFDDLEKKREELCAITIAEVMNGQSVSRTLFLIEKGIKEFIWVDKEARRIDHLSTSSTINEAIIKLLQTDWHVELEGVDYEEYDLQGDSPGPSLLAQINNNRGMEAFE